MASSAGGKQKLSQSFQAQERRNYTSTPKTASTALALGTNHFHTVMSADTSRDNSDREGDQTAGAAVPDQQKSSWTSFLKRCAVDQISGLNNADFCLASPRYQATCLL